MAKTKTVQKFYDLERDGVTQGMLSMYQECKQKAKWFCSGWSQKSASMALTYGTIGHGILEMAYRDMLDGNLIATPTPAQVQKYVDVVEKQWKKENPRADKKALEYLEMSLLIAESTLPAYFDFYKRDIKELKWYKIEGSFNVPITLKDGRKIPIRGKMDGIFQNPKRFWLFESKFKSMINEADLVDTLPIEMQINVYIWAMSKLIGKIPAGVLYNIVRRSCLRQKQTESMQQFARRIAEDIKTRPEFYFIRLEIAMTQEEILSYETELQAMVQDFVDWWEGRTGHYKSTAQCIAKYGRCQYLPLCASRDYSLFAKRNKFYRELEDY